MVLEPAAEDDWPLSPELVLVSGPEVAQRARERLPDRLSFAGPAAPVAPAVPVPVPFERPPPPPYPRIAIEDLLPGPRRRSRGRVALVACLLGAVVAAGAYLAATRWHAGDAAPVAEAQPGAAQRAAPAEAPLTVSTVRAPAASPKPHARPRVAPKLRPATRTTRRAKRAQPQLAGGSTTPAAATPAPTTPAGTTPAPSAQTPATAKPKPPRTPTGFVPARTWVWVASPGVSAYEVTFYLDGRVVLRARPTTARFELPNSFRFHAGRYRWTVSAPAAQKPIVDASFVLSAAAAAAANGS